MTTFTVFSRIIIYMIKITAIEKKKRLYKVEFDKHDTIYVTEDTVVKYMMSRAAEYSEEQLKEIIEFANFSRGKNLAIYYISFKMRTKVEVIKYLQEHEIDNRQIARIIDELESSKYIDDASYTESFINSKINSQTNGPYQIKQKLSTKGIKTDLIDEIMSQTYTRESQVNVATNIAEKLVMQKYSKLPLKMLKIKINQSLVTKGFSYDIAKTAIESLELESDSEQESDLIQSEIEKSLRKYGRKYDGYDLKQRVIQSLARKGFDFDTINRELREYDF